MLIELKRLIEANPHFKDKLQFPEINTCRLRTLINQRYIYIYRKFLNDDCVYQLQLFCFGCSLNWQHQLCKNPKADPEIKSLLLDHKCGPSSSSVANPSAVGGFPSGSLAVSLHGE